MDNERHGLRVTGEYAIHDDREYFAYRLRIGIVLYCDDDPLPQGFEPSSMDWVKGEKLVPLTEVQHLMKVRTTCVWRGHPFQVGIVMGDNANLVYLGKNFDEVSGLPGMRRPDKYEVRGRAPVSELTGIEESVSDVPLGN